MHVVVLGAGVIGVTTAYYLARDGHRVTVIDRAAQVAAGASHANGGQLSYSFTDSLATPAFLARLPRYLLGLDPAVRIRRILTPSLLSWAGAFMGQCTGRRARGNTLAALEQAQRSADLLDQLAADVTIDFSRRHAGKLVLLPHDKALRDATHACAMKQSHGCETRVMTFAEACELEPALARMPGDYVGVVYSVNDDVADARSFTEGLAHWLETHADVRFEMNRHVERIERDGSAACGVSTARDTYAADAVVVCAGAWSDRLLRPLRIRSGIYPMRGYSVTLPLGPAPPQVSVTDHDHKIVFSRLNGHMRIAGFADFVGFDTGLDDKRIDDMLAVAQRVAPHAADYAQEPAHGWGGFRPMRPDGRPRIGATDVPRLYLNTGHGMLGWTLACASADELTRAVRRDAH